MLKLKCCECHPHLVGLNVAVLTLRGPVRRLFGLPLDPNRADASTLETLPGIGPARAQAIVRERCRRRFESPTDLLRVHGIGPRTLARLSPWLAVEPAREARCAVH